MKAIGALVLIGAAGVSAYAQYNVQHQAPVALERNSINNLEFSIPGISQADIQDAVFFYRYDGDFSYQQQEVRFQNQVFRVQFNPDNPSAGLVEYYFEVRLISGEIITFPASSPNQNPVEVEIVESLDEDKPRLEQMDYSILSPLPGNGVTSNDALIAIALFYDAETIVPGEFKLILNDQDVSEEADIGNYYISYIPVGLSSGSYTIAVEYETDNETYLITEWQFSVVEPGMASFTGFGTPSQTLQATAELTARNQVIAGNINNAYTGRTRISGRNGDLSYSAHGYLTTQESARLQPQNRYGVNVTYGDILNFDAGHVYPSMSQFTISGRRVHGINTSVHLLDQRLNFQFLYGELDRNISNQYDSLKVDPIVNNSGEVVDRNYFLTYQNGGRGTFSRKVTGGRIGIGNEQKIQFGLHAIKIQDDTTSIFNVQDYRDILLSNITLNNNLSPSDRDSLIANPDELQVSGGKIRPRDNIVAGGDLKMSFLNNRLRFNSEAVVSALNNDIYGGPLNVERADELGFDIGQGTADILQQLSWLIIINENMNTLPFRISEDENGDLTTNTFFPTSILAGNSEVSYRQQNNNLRLQYRWIGPNFYSLANSTIRKDVAGFTLTDRLNLLSNRLYVTLGYENLNNNVSGTRNSTTNTTTYRTSTSWYPVDRNLPRVTVGFRYRVRDNDVERENFLLPDNLVDAAVQNVRQERRIVNGQDSLVTLVMPTARMNQTFNFNTSITQQFDFLNARNDASINFTSLNTTDQVFAYGDLSSTAISLSLNSRFREMPLETQVGFTYNNTKSGSGQSDINIAGFYVGGNYRLLENRLSVNGRLAITGNNISNRPLLIEDYNDPTTPRDDYYVLGNTADENNFQTYVLQAGAQFDIDENHGLIFDANLTNVSGRGNANDRIVQLRYVFRF